MRNQLNFDEIQERHLDELLYLAFQQMDALDAQEASRETDLPPDAKEMEPRIYSRFLQKQREVEGKRQRASRRTRRKRRFSQAISIAACLVVLLGIAAPFAVAYVPSIRSRVLGLLLQFEADHVDVEMREESTFVIPSEWQGLYFPSYIPDGYVLQRMSDHGETAELVNAAGDILFFGEYVEGSSLAVDSEGAQRSSVEINGSTALVLEKDYTSVLWNVEDRYFLVQADASADLALEVARSVLRIVQ